MATIGLAAEWVWNQNAYQPWTTNLLPDAIWLCLVVGLGGAVVGAAFATAVRREKVSLHVPGRFVATAGAAVVVALRFPCRGRLGRSPAIQLEHERRRGERRGHIDTAQCCR